MKMRMILYIFRIWAHTENFRVAVYFNIWLFSAVIIFALEIQQKNDYICFNHNGSHFTLHRKHYLQI